MPIAGPDLIRIDVEVVRGLEAVAVAGEAREMFTASARTGSSLRFSKPSVR